VNATGFLDLSHTSCAHCPPLVVFGVAIVLPLMALAAAYLGFGKMGKRMRENLQMLGRPPQTILKETE
jgi:hypothetical protein